MWLTEQQTHQIRPGRTSEGLSSFDRKFIHGAGIACSMCPSGAMDSASLRIWGLGVRVPPGTIFLACQVKFTAWSCFVSIIVPTKIRVSKKVLLGKINLFHSCIKPLFVVCRLRTQSRFLLVCSGRSQLCWRGFDSPRMHFLCQGRNQCSVYQRFLVED